MQSSRFIIAYLMNMTSLVNLLTSRLQKIIKANRPTAKVVTKDMQSRKLSHLEQAIVSANTEVEAIPKDSEDTYNITIICRSSWRAACPRA